MGRSILAVAVGFFLIIALVIGTELAFGHFSPGSFDKAGNVASTVAMLFMLAYVGVYAIGGCYLTAKLAPNKPMRHALILGGLGLAFNIMGEINLWNTVPLWYHLVAIGLTLPYAWIGGKLYLNGHPERAVA